MFKEIPGYSDYEVDHWGNVWSKKLKRFIPKHAGPDGYAQLNLKNDKSKTYPARLHHLILLAHVGPRPEGYVGSHKNDIKYDNQLSNLEWTTKEENAKNKCRNGKSQKGEKVHSSKLKEYDVLFIRDNYPKKSAANLAKKFNVSIRTINSIITFKTWKHVGGKTHKTHILSRDLIINIRKEFNRIGKKSNATELAFKYDIPRRAIVRIVNFKTYGRIK